MAAGGGSRLFFRAGLFVVGPESASAHPGPVCYRKGGFLYRLLKRMCGKLFHCMTMVSVDVLCVSVLQNMISIRFSSDDAKLGQRRARNVEIAVTFTSNVKI